MSALVASSASAQSLGRLGAAGGIAVAASVPVVLGLATVRARSGEYVFNQDQALRQIGGTAFVLGIVGIGGAVWRGDDFVPRDAAAGVALGTLAGALLGRAAGQLASDSGVGRWSGLAIGMGMGAIAGGVVGWLRDPVADDAEGGGGGVPLGFTVSF